MTWPVLLDLELLLRSDLVVGAALERELRAVWSRDAPPGALTQEFVAMLGIEDNNRP